MTAYYNEFDPKAAAWLRELIRQRHIAPGIVDERSIADVRPADLAGFTQCHFFAGIGVWSYALRLAGWPDDRPVWTGSCPCQPFSDAGAGGEFDDARHLWPTWFWLVRECRPVVVFGEQVASKDALAWLDHVSTDLEGEAYTFGAVDTCAAGFGAPHIRQRLYFVAARGVGLADSSRERRQQNRRGASGDEAQDGREGRIGVGEDSDYLAAGGGAVGELGHARGSGREELRRDGIEQPQDAARGRAARRAARPADQDGVAQGDPVRAGLEGHLGDVGDGHESGRVGALASGSSAAAGSPRGVGPLADSTSRLALDEREQRIGEHGLFAEGGRHHGGARVDQFPAVGVGLADANPAGQRELGGSGLSTLGDSPCGDDAHRRGSVNGFWADADWLPCRDGKARPVEPGTFPLARGAAERVGRLRGYGNGLVAQQAAGFIEVAREELDGVPA